MTANPDVYSCVLFVNKTLFLHGVISTASRYRLMSGHMTRATQVCPWLAQYIQHYTGCIMNWHIKQKGAAFNNNFKKGFLLTLAH